MGTQFSHSPFVCVLRVQYIIGDIVPASTGRKDKCNIFEHFDILFILVTYQNRIYIISRKDRQRRRLQFIDHR
jgi:hypothetical protein